METFRQLSDLTAGFGPSVVTVGNFDGVHRGHRFLLRSVVESARERGFRSIAVTFDPHPTHLLRPEAAPALITPDPAEKLRLMAESGIDAALLLSFTSEFSQHSAEAFVQRILLDGLHAVEVHEGGNFRFGYRASSGVEDLRILGEKLGFAVRVYDALQVRGLEVSSSNIRRLITAGDVRRARWLLGRPFSILSHPARGRGIGTRLTVPTINLAAYSGVVPGAGVYVTRMEIGPTPGLCFDAVTNVGTRPTFADSSFAIETHLLDFRPVDLMDSTPLRLTFLARLREERTWPSPEALREQIGRDVRQAQRYFARLPLADQAAEASSSASS